MKSTTIAAARKLIDLEAKCDVHLFGVYRGEDGRYYREDGTEATGAGDFKSVKGALAATGVVAAGGAAAAGGMKLAKRYGADQIASPKAALAAVGTGVRRDVVGAMKTGARAVLTPVAGALDSAAVRNARMGRIAADSQKKVRGIRRTLGLMGKAFVRGMSAKDVSHRVIELANKIEIVEA